MRHEDPAHVHGRCVACNGDAVTTEFICAGCVRQIRYTPSTIVKGAKPFKDGCKTCSHMDRTAPNFACTDCGGGFSRQSGERDAVNHPSHYTSHPSGVECIAITEHHSFCLGNAIKYLWRCDHKNGVEDLKKARWYIDREIARRDGK